MDLQSKIVYAVIQSDKGSPLKDFLTDEEIDDALSMLADILIVTGSVPPIEEL